MTEQTIEISSIRNCRCVICFSHDRKLLVMKNQSFMAMFWPEISFQPDDKVCWECEYIIGKMIKFKQKAMTTQQLLMNWKCVQANSLSSLSVTDLVHISYTPDQDDSPDNKDTVIDKAKSSEISEIKDNVEDNAKPIKIELDILDNIKVEYENKFDDLEHISYGDEPNSDHGTVVKTEEMDEENWLEGSVDKEGGNEKTNKTLEEGPVKLYNREMVLIATIEIMGEEAMMQWREKEMAKESFLSHKLKCLTCIEKFIVERICEEHKIKHDPRSGDFVCTICEQRFVSVYDLERHRQEHYLCYKCVDCADEFRTQKDIQVHHYKCHTTPRCRECEVVFETKAQLAQHKRTVHDKRFLCTVCNRAFSTNRSLKAHMQRHEDSRMMECEICHMELKGIRGLRRHNKRVHSLLNDEDRYCTECNIQFKTEHTYKQHMRKAMKHRTADDLKYICDTCGLKFVYKGYLAAHISRIHMRTEKNCKLCSKTLAILRAHTGERPYMCNSCPATFTQSGPLYTHKKLMHRPAKT